MEEGRNETKREAIASMNLGMIMNRGWFDHKGRNEEKNG